MTKPARPGQKRVDETQQAFSTLAEALLDVFFVEPANEVAWKAISRQKPRPVAADAEAITMGSVDLSDLGEAKFVGRAGSPVITVAIAHPKFNATIAADYDLEIEALTDVRLLQLDGDRKQARAYAGKWFEDLYAAALADEDDDAEEDLDDLLGGLLADDESPFAGQDDPGEPPPPTAADKAMVEALAKRLAREMKRKNPDMMAYQDDMFALEQSPQCLMPMLDGMVAACTTRRRDDALIAAWELLLEGQLTLIRYRIDSGWAWAARMAEAFQRKLIEIGQTGTLSGEDFAAIAGVLGEAKIEVTPEIRVALAEAGLTLPEQTGPDGLEDMMRGLLDQMASAVSEPFEAVAALEEATRVMPVELRSYMTHEFALSPHAMLRDTVPLLLLSEEQEVRRSAAAALRQTADPETMSPEALRRMIAVRNWVPEGDRPEIDQAIRQARSKGVACAPWPAARDLMITASMIDGSGSQSLIVTGRGARAGVLGGLLLKRGVGVADSWCDTEAPRRDINSTLDTIRQTGQACEVDRSYLDLVIQHAIAAGMPEGRAPGAGVLRIAEFSGGSEWRGVRLDIAAEANRLFDELPARQRSPAEVEVSLHRSGEWIDEDFAESWFLDGPEVRAVVSRGPKRDAAAAARRVMDEIMPRQRAEWAERFLLLAERARAAKDPVHQGRATDFIILAHGLCGDRELASIPLMAAIARYTVKVTKIARW